MTKVNKDEIIIPNKIFLAVTFFLSLWVSAVLFFCILTRQFNLSFFESVIKMREVLYHPYHYFDLVEYSLLGYFYLFLFLFFLFAKIGCACVEKFSGKELWGDSSQRLMIVSLMGLLAIVVFQQFDRHISFQKERATFQGMSLSERNAVFLEKAYRYPSLSKKYLKNRHQAELITDMDITQDPGMFMRTALAYHLYPEISIRRNKNVPKDCLVILSKQDPLKYIPSDYRIVFATKDQDYIVAVKKDIQP